MRFSKSLLTVRKPFLPRARVLVSCYVLSAWAVLSSCVLHADLGASNLDFRSHTNEQLVGSFLKKILV